MTEAFEISPKVTVLPVRTGEADAAHEAVHAHLGAVVQRFVVAARFDDDVGVR